MDYMRLATSLEDIRLFPQADGKKIEKKYSMLMRDCYFERHTYYKDIKAGENTCRA